MVLILLLGLSAVVVGFVCHARRHFSRLVPTHRVDEQHGKLQIRRYPSLPFAEVRVSGNSSTALKTGTQLLNRYFREEQIGRFALPLLAEKVDAADSIWTMAPTVFPWGRGLCGALLCIVICHLHVPTEADLLLIPPKVAVITLGGGGDVVQQAAEEAGVLARVDGGGPHVVRA